MIITLDMFAFIEKVIALILLALVSQESLRRKMYGLAITTFGTWLIVFRLLAIRAVTLRVDVFNKKEIFDIANFAQSGQVAFVTDAILIIGLIVLLVTFARYFIELRKK